MIYIFILYIFWEYVHLLSTHKRIDFHCMLWCIILWLINWWGWTFDICCPTRVSRCCVKHEMYSSELRLLLRSNYYVFTRCTAPILARGIPLTTIWNPESDLAPAPAPGFVSDSSMHGGINFPKLIIRYAVYDVIRRYSFKLWKIKLIGFYEI